MQKAERCWVSSVSAPHGINHWRARCGENRTAGSAGGRTEKDLHHRHLAVRPTHPSADAEGMEAMHALRKGQGRIFAYRHPNPDAVIVEKAFAYA